MNKTHFMTALLMVSAVGPLNAETFYKEGYYNDTIYQTDIDGNPVRRTDVDTSSKKWTSHTHEAHGNMSVSKSSSTKKNRVEVTETTYQ